MYCNCREAIPLLENINKGDNRYNDLLQSLEKDITSKEFDRIKYCLKGIYLSFS